MSVLKERNGGWTFKVICYNENTCREFVMESKTFSFLRWLAYWFALNAISFQFGLHVQDASVLWCLVPILCLGILLKINLKVKKESLLVIASLGCQVTTTFLSGRKIVQFYDKAQVKDLLINEGISMQRVIHYLAILLNHHGDDSLVPLFQHSWPRLPTLTQIYTGTQTVFKNS